MKKKNLNCNRKRCFANDEGMCDCLNEAYPNNVKCPFFKDRKTFKRYVLPYSSSQKNHE